MTDGGLFAWGLLGCLIFSYALGALVLWDAQRRSPGGVRKRLARPNGRHSVAVPKGRFTWNPSVPAGPANRVNGPGKAHYWMDEQGLIHLRFVAPGKEGQEFVSSEPLPTSPPLPLALRAIKLAYPALAAGGAVIGFTQTGGSHQDRMDAAAWFALVGWLLAWLLMRLALGVIRGRTRAGT